MNLRCYLRGLGIGIIVTAILMGLSTKPEEMSDAQIIARAKHLGMIDGSATLAQEAEEQLAQLEQDKEEGDSVEQAKEETSQENTEENPNENNEDTIENSGEDMLEEGEKSALDEKLEEDLLGIRETGDEEEVLAEEEITEETQQEEISEGELPEDNEQPEEEVPENSGQPEEEVPETGAGHILEIRGGDTSVSVSKKLVEMGLVTDASEYDRYLCQNGFDKKICTGTYEIKSNATYEEIAKIITKSN